MDPAPECSIAWDGAALGVVLLALPVAALISAATVALYRRAVDRAMRHSAGERVPAADVERAPPAIPLEVVASPLADGSAPDGWRGSVRRRAWIYVAAGCAQSVTVVALTFWLADIEFRPFRALATWLPFAWPIVLTYALVALPARRQRLKLVAGYFALLLAVDGAAEVFGMRERPGFGELLALWGLVMGLPTLVLALLSNRAWRSVGLLALLVSLALSAGYQLGFQGLGCLTLSTRSALLLSGFDYLLAALVALSFALAWWRLKAMVRRYTAKRYGDEMLVVDSWWLVVTALETLFSLGAGGPPALAILMSYVLYKTVAALGLRRLSEAEHPLPRTLLLLRVFGFGGRSRQLIDLLGKSWRNTGPIAMIGGTDLATSLIEPDELMRFWSGRLRESFIANGKDLAGRLEHFDDRRDPDGRFRINEFFCHDNTWQATVRSLARRSRLVLMDLRGFDENKGGCEFELGLLLDEVPLEKIVLVVDDTTKTDALEGVLRRKWALLSVASPNRGLDRPLLRLLQVGSREADLQALPGRLLQLAGSPT